MRTFCVACAKFHAGDRMGELLAVAATAPYFAIYHAAVLLHARRELHMAFVLVGLLLTSVLSSLIKDALQQPRPAACKLLGNCHKHGMPSSHSAVMAYAATTALLLFLHRSAAAAAGAGAGKRRRAAGAGASGASRAALVDRLARFFELLEVQALMALTAAVAAGRVYLQYHTPQQVCAGLALGAATALVWWRLTLAACTGRWAPMLLRLAPLRALSMRNTLGFADVHASEAALFGSPAGGAASPKASPRRRFWWRLG